jgi:hypothetical protein
MRLPSIGLVVTAALRTARRFPFVLGAAMVAAYAGIGLANHRGNDPEDGRLLVAAMLGFPLLFALTVFAERRVRTEAPRWLLLAAGVAILVAFWVEWPAWSSRIQVLRFLQLGVAFHLLAAFLPYAGFSEPNGFWQYNKTLFLRFLLASLYSVVLCAGLAVALLAVDKLLGVKVSGESYGRLLMVIALVFNTWFFAGGVPEELGALEARTDYPPGLRIFTQYVLVPIVALYLLILTIYLAKVVVTQQWPSGWIGYLVSSVATVGILSWLLVRPLEERAEYAWVKTFTKGFYIVLIPAIVMLWLSIWKRVAQYGITEPRYFLIVLSLWLAGIAVYFTFSRSRSIKLIPASLCVLALLTFAGPTGAYAVSRANQVSRLRSLLERDDLLQNGHLRRTTREVSLADRREISGTLRYLLATHGREVIASWLFDSLTRTLGTRGAAPTQLIGDAEARAIMASLNIDYVGAGAGAEGEYFSYYSPLPPGPISIAGYTYELRLSRAAMRDSVKIANRTFVRVSADSTALHVVRDGAMILSVSLKDAIDTVAAFRQANPGRPIPAAVLRVETRSGDAAALVYFTQLGGIRRLGGSKLTTFEGELFLKLP